MFQILLLVVRYQQNSQAVLAAAGINGLTDDKLNTRVNRHASSAVFFILLMFKLSFAEVKFKGLELVWTWYFLAGDWYHYYFDTNPNFQLWRHFGSCFSWHT